MDLVAFAHQLSLGQADRAWIAESTPPRLAQYISRAEAALAGHDVHHVHFASMVADPLSEIGRIYTWLGAELGGMRDYEAHMKTAEFAADPRPWQRIFRSRQKRTISHMVRK